MNLTLGSGDEENGRPLLGGLGAVTAGGVRAGGSTSITTVVVEQIARVASIISSGGIFGGGLGGSGSGCPWIGAVLPNGKYAGEVDAGDDLYALSEDGHGWLPHKVREVGASSQPCVRLTTQGGIELTTSLSTPLTTFNEFGKLVATPIAVGVFVPILDEAGFRWEAIDAIEDRGELPVRLIDCAGGTFAAGDRAGRYIFTHNKLATDPEG